MCVLLSLVGSMAVCSARVLVALLPVHVAYHSHCNNNYNNNYNSNNNNNNKFSRDADRLISDEVLK
jgi:hypothetical protein